MLFKVKIKFIAGKATATVAALEYENRVHSVPLKIDFRNFSVN
jgi:hypothetical protein